MCLGWQNSRVWWQAWVKWEQMLSNLKKGYSETSSSHKAQISTWLGQFATLQLIIWTIAQIGKKTREIKSSAACYIWEYFARIVHIVLPVAQTWSRLQLKAPPEFVDFVGTLCDDLVKPTRPIWVDWNCNCAGYQTWTTGEEWSG